MNTPDVNSTIVSLRAMRDQLQQLVDSGDSIIDDASNRSVLFTSSQAIDTLERQGNQFLGGDFSPFSESLEAWAAWSDVAQSTGDSLAASVRLNGKWTITYFAGQVAQQAADNLKGIGLGVGAGLALLVVLVVLVKL